jgi:hypothetical protein
MEEPGRRRWIAAFPPFGPSATPGVPLGFDPPGDIVGYQRIEVIGRYRFVPGNHVAFVGDDLDFVRGNQVSGYAIRKLRISESPRPKAF